MDWTRHNTIHRLGPLAKQFAALVLFLGLSLNFTYVFLLYGGSAFIVASASQAGGGGSNKSSVHSIS